MRRRHFLVAATSALVPLAAFAEEADRRRRVGVLTPSDQQWEAEAFRGALRKLGYSEDHNLKLDVHSARGSLDRLPELAGQLVASRPDVIVAVNTPGTRAAIAVTKTIPIVMAVVGDPVGSGFVASLAHPGGNVTGVSNLSGELAGKRLSVLKELKPTIRRVAVLYNPSDPVTTPQIADTKTSAAKIGIEIQLFPAKHPAELDAVFTSVVQWRADAALWLAGQAATLEKRTIELALENQLPVMYAIKRDVRAGGLISYFAEYVELFGRVAVYVAKILNGAKPADLPVEQATKFELVINLKTARALGLPLPSALIAGADEVIE